VAAILRVKAASRRTQVIVGATALWLALRVWSFAGIVGHGSAFPDTQAYEQTSHLSLFGLDFWTWYKPWGTPLLWKLLPGPTSASAPIAQWLLATAAWWFLAFVCYRVFRHSWTGATAFALVLAFDLVPAVSVWDGALLSESLTYSLAAVLLAALILTAERPSWRRAAAVFVVAFVFAGTRTSDGYLTPFILIPFAVVLWRRPRIALFLAIGSVAIGALTWERSNVREWQVSFAEIVALRMTHEPSAYAYFTAHGMPYEPALDAEVLDNRYPLSSFESTASLDWFFPWFNRSGRTVYTDYLLSHPRALLLDPIDDLGRMITPSTSIDDLQGLPLDVYEARGYRAPLPRAIARILYPTSPTVVLAWSVAVLVALGALVLAGHKRRFWIVPVLGIVTIVPQGIIVYVGSDTSIGRHAILLATLLRLSAILGTLCVIDELHHPHLVGGARRTAPPTERSD
jgi:hypothetical protein